jgi:hypothetical protein
MTPDLAHTNRVQLEPRISRGSGCSGTGGAAPGDASAHHTQRTTMKAPNLYTLDGLHKLNREVGASHDGKVWYPARPLGLDTISNRIRCAWLVFTGRADAVTWPAGQ